MILGTLAVRVDPTAERVVIMCGGAMGGLLGPAHGTYQVLGDQFAEQGIATMRVGYRRPNDLDSCTHDLCAAAELAARKQEQCATTAQQLQTRFGG